MKKFTFNVVQVVEVELDEEKFNDEYMKAFSEVMWNVDDVQEVAEYIARQKALYDGWPVEFVPENSYTAKVIDEYTEENY